MKRMTTIATVLFLAVLAVLSTRVAAQDSNTQERSFLTFSAPVELPGVTLPAGTYTFRLADTPSRNVVQVLSRDEKEMMGQWTFVQAERPDVSNDTVIMFKENREGQTAAVQFWYYPGERIGKEFIYPKDQAQKIASRTGASVLSDDGRVSANTTVASTDAQGAVTPWPKESASADTPAKPSGDADQPAKVAEAAEPPSVRASADTTTDAADRSTLRDAPAPSQPTAAAGSLTGNRGVAPVPETTVAQAEPAPSPVGTSGIDRNAAVDTQASNELPRTASPLPLSGLIGLLSLAGALSARAAATVRK